MHQKMVNSKNSFLEKMFKNDPEGNWNPVIYFNCLKQDLQEHTFKNG